MEAGCFIEAALQVVGGDGLDGVVDGEFDDDIGLCGVGEGGLEEQAGERDEEERRGI